jgi:hypothetical protein
MNETYALEDGPVVAAAYVPFVEPKTTGRD